MSYLKKKLLILKKCLSNIVTRSISGTPPLILTAAKKLVSIEVKGNTAQNGVPTPDMKVDVVGVGDKTYNEYSLLTGRSVVNFGAYENTSIRSFTGSQLIVGLAPNNYYYPQHITDYTIHSDNSLEATRADTSGSIGYGIGIDFAVMPGEKIYISSKETENTYLGVGYYTANGQYIKTTTFTVGQLITIPDECYWIVVVVRIAGGGRTHIKAEDLCLVRNVEDAVEYKPFGCAIPLAVSGKNLYYQSQTFELYSPAPLYKIDDLADTLSLDLLRYTATLTQNISKVSLTGDESWQLYSTGADTMAFRANLLYANWYLDAVYCSHFKRLESATTDEEGFAPIDVSMAVVFRIYKKTAPDIEAFKQWLAEQNSSGNPVTLYYKSTSSTDTDVSSLIDWSTVPGLPETAYINVETSISPSNLTIEFI